MKIVITVIAKRLPLVIIAILLLTGCGKVARLPEEFTHTGCSSGPAETKSMTGGEPSLLILKYENGGLRVIRTNAIMNCSIKISGISCDVSIDEDVIRYRVYENDPYGANCLCLVKQMSSLVTGLEPGRKYTFVYDPPYMFEPQVFTFKKGLRLVQSRE